MTSIPVAICRISDNNFKRVYLKKERPFLIFYCISEMWIITEIIASERDIYLSV